MTIQAPAVERAVTLAASPASYEVGNSTGLSQAMSDIDRLGWDSPAGDAVLRYARTRVVNPAVRRARLRGAEADEAASTGWAAAWRTLNRPDLRHQVSPWGLVAAAVRREITSDNLASAYRTNRHAAWRLARLHRAVSDTAAAPETAVPDLGADADWLRGVLAGSALCPLSLDGLSDDGWEPVHLGSEEGVDELGPRLAQVVDALAAVGWPRSVAVSSVAWIADAAAKAAESQARRTPELPGWRELAERTGLPSWRTRRLAALLLGYRDTVGVVARMVRDGDHVLHDPETRRALRSTVHRWLPSPCATATDRPRPAQAAA